MSALRDGRRGRAKLHLWALYTRAIVHEFRWTLFALGVFIGLGTLILVLSTFDGHSPAPLEATVAAFELLAGEPLLGAPPNGLVATIYILYPLIGLGVGAEAIVRLSLLLFSKRHGEKEWAKIMASTYENHVVLCGLGHLGIRVMERLLELGVDVVVIEKDPLNSFIETAIVLKVPVLVLDAKNESALAEAGVPRARAIVICSNDVMANLEIALDARKLNAKIRVVMRLFDQNMAAKLGNALSLDVPFSSSALAAPTVATAIFDAKVLSSFELDGKIHLVTELPVATGAPLVGAKVGSIDGEHHATVLGLRRAGAPCYRPAPDERLVAGDELVIHVRADRLAGVTRAARG